MKITKQHYDFYMQKKNGSLRPSWFDLKREPEVSVHGLINVQNPRDKRDYCFHIQNLMVILKRYNVKSGVLKEKCTMILLNALIRKETSTVRVLKRIIQKIEERYRDPGKERFLRYFCGDLGEFRKHFDAKPCTCGLPSCDGWELTFNLKEEKN